MDPSHRIPYPTSLDVVGTSGDRFPQWSIQETRDFLVFRSELDASFMETKRNKPLWELISARMKEMGHNRSPDQCKCKWKNLVTRYKGSEGMEAEGMMMRQQHQFPFYKELQAIFAARMQRMVWLESEIGAKKPEISDQEDDSDSGDEGKGRTQRKRRKPNQTQTQTQNPGSSSSASNRMINEIKEIMTEFMKQQNEMEMEFTRVYEAREAERRSREIEWRRRMEALEIERMKMVRNMKEKEEERRARDEERAEKRDALISALLDRIRRREQDD